MLDQILMLSLLSIKIKSRLERCCRHVNQNFKCLKMVLEYAYQIGIELLIPKLSSVFLYL